MDTAKTKCRIVVLFHSATKRFNLRKYAIFHLAEVWKKEGHQVFFLFGIRNFVPADVCFMHVDLSVVPDQYMEFAHRYPVVINGEIKDIRKSRVSNNLVLPGDDYRGPVIVKTDLNYAGWPERMTEQRIPSLLLLKMKHRLGFAKGEIFAKSDYPIYPSVSQVPERYLDRSDYVIERFVPEKQGEFYCLNMYTFLGNTTQSMRLYSHQPIVLSNEIAKWEHIPPPAEIIQLKSQLGIDYGKIDYLMQDGRVNLFDVNKTIGTGHRYPKQRFLKVLRSSAQGLYDFI